MSAALRQLGAMTMLGIRGATPGDAKLEEDLDACAHAGVRMVILFDRDVATGAERNVRSPGQVRALTEHIRARLGNGALVAIDQEGGRVQRLSCAHGFKGWPSARAHAVLAVGEQSERSQEMARALAEAGVDLNFAPCVDVNINPASPVIGALDRAYSDEPAEVAACALRVVRAHQATGVGCVLKHFPGHGSASTDSHHDLVDVSKSWDRERELAPYRVLLDENVGVMTGHLILSQFDVDRPASLSRSITTGLLRDELGFTGPVFTDALDMEGVRARWSLRETIRLAFEAGADVFVHACNSARGEYAPDVVRAMEALATELGSLEARAARSLERVRLLAEPRSSTNRGSTPYE
ncbi:MAG: glycoside hydrolase family 3 N-terminal domain-containing protein [Phycisphaerales bacterium]|jgi:beta-N-acetylhexosaminidase